MRSVIAASISAPRAARFAGAATSRTRAVPREDSSSAGSAASQTMPFRATPAPRDSNIEARSSGSSARRRSDLRRAILVDLIEELPVQLLHRLVPLPAHQERRPKLPEFAIEIALPLRRCPDPEHLVFERARLGVRTEHHIQVSDDRAEEVDLL